MPTESTSIERARSFVSRVQPKHFINGEWTLSEGEETFEVIDPSTEELLGTLASGNEKDINRAVQAARKAFEAASWAATTPYERTNTLLRLAALLEVHAEELAAIQSLETGMPYSGSVWVTRSMGDVLRYYAGWTTKMYGRTYPTAPGVSTYTLREPLGVVGAIIPWNGPILYICWKLATALATGNTFVLKPAEQAPLTAMRFGELVQELDLPPGVVNIVTGLGETAGAALVAHPQVNKITFTGSTAVGKQIMSRASSTLKKLSLELGGKSPVLVFADANLDQAIPAILMGFTGNSGQACTAGTRVFIHDKIYDEFIHRLVQGAQQIKIGMPFEPLTQMGPLTSKEQFDRVTHYISVGQTEGAELRTGGKRHGTNGYFIQPTVFTQVNNQMRIAREEIFGPVGALMRFTDESEVLTQANETEYGLAASIWTQDNHRAQAMARALQAGIVWINTVFELDPIAPFGGTKSSGLGRELGSESIDDFTQIKTVVNRYS